ncbi:MAG TPA: STAS domain-containing protein [Gaiellales bacterium]|nr:STAS domain-containing protein [Gaiellales bacterium]
MNVRRVTGAAVVELVGEHDVSTVASLADALERIGREDARIVDLSAATFIDSSILTTLVGAASRDGGAAATVMVAPPGSPAARLFALTQAAAAMSIYESADVALARVMIRE